MTSTVEEHDTSISDDELMRSLASGNIDSLGELYKRHCRTVRTAIGRFAPEISHAERDELSHEVFLTLNKTAHRFASGVKFRTWLFGVIVRTAKHWRRDTWLRRRLLSKKNGEAVGMALLNGAGTEELTLLKETLAKAVENLPRSLREVLLLCAVDGFAGEEAAQILGISHRAVRTRMHRARRMMIEKISCDFWEREGGGS